VKKKGTLADPKKEKREFSASFRKEGEEGRRKGPYFSPSPLTHLVGSGKGEDDLDVLAEERKGGEKGEKSPLLLCPKEQREGKGSILEENSTSW